MKLKLLKTIRLPVLALAGVTMLGGYPGWDRQITPAPVVPTQNTSVVERSLPMNVFLAFDPQAAGSISYQPVSWYKNKHWWKRNAPIIGGAGGGALVGGLIGGGAGAVVGGAVGGGGGYLYKRHKEHHYHHYRGYE
jgi:outer membrane lipoprotein SlyB